MDGFKKTAVIRIGFLIKNRIITRLLYRVYHIILIYCRTGKMILCLNHGTIFIVEISVAPGISTVMADSSHIVMIIVAVCDCLSIPEGD